MQLINPAQSLYAYAARPVAAACPRCGGQSCCPPHQCRAYGSSVLCVAPPQLSANPGPPQVGGALQLGPVVAAPMTSMPRLRNQHHGPVPRQQIKSTHRAVSSATAGALAAVLRSMSNPLSVDERDRMCAHR